MVNGKLSKFVLGLLAGSAIVVMATSASAQTAEDAAQDVKNDSGHGREIVVTAQKREQNIQDVPISVTAFSGDELESMQITNVSDLRGFAPNLYIEPALGAVTTASVYIRGSGQINPSFFFDAPVPIYVDGVYMARAFGALVDLYDTERVEVLRGPQGTLFGRNASAGAIQIITKLPPLDDAEFAGTLSYGSKDQRNANATFGIPIVEGKIGARFSATYRRNGGFMLNTTFNERSNDDNILAGRAALLFSLSEKTELILRTDFLRDRSDPPGASAIIDPDGNPYTFESNYRDNQAVGSTDTFTASATVNHSFDAVDLTSITAYRSVSNFGRADGDGRSDRPLFFENLGQGLDQSQFTQELYLTGDRLGSTDLEWTVGSFYLHEKNDSFFAISIVPFIPATRQFFNQKTDTIGVYGQATYPVTDKFDVTGGLRYTWDSKDFLANQVRVSDGSPVPAFDFSGNTTVKRVTWTGAATFEAKDNVNFYVRAGTGFRAGNFNGGAFNAADILSGALGTESIFSVEGGIKSQWLDNRLRFNATYYYKKIKNLQLEILTPQGVTNLNLDVNVQGVEIEIAATPIDGLNFFGNLGTLNDDVAGGGKLPRAAAVTFQAGFNYTYDMSRNGKFKIGANYSNTGDYLQGRPDDLLRAVDGFGLLDASATYETEDGRWSFTVSGANLTKELYQVSSFNIPGLVQIQIPNRPRTWLATLGVRF